MPRAHVGTRHRLLRTAHGRYTSVVPPYVAAAGSTRNAVHVTRAGSRTDIPDGTSVHVTIIRIHTHTAFRRAHAAYAFHTRRRGHGYNGAEYGSVRTAYARSVRARARHKYAPRTHTDKYAAHTRGHARSQMYHTARYTTARNGIAIQHRCARHARHPRAARTHATHAVDMTARASHTDITKYARHAGRITHAHIPRADHTTPYAYAYGRYAARRYRAPTRAGYAERIPAARIRDDTVRTRGQTRTRSSGPRHTPRYRHAYGQMTRRYVTHTRTTHTRHDRARYTPRTMRGNADRITVPRRSDRRTALRARD